MKIHKQRQKQRVDKPYIKEIDFIFYNEMEIRQSILDEQTKARPIIRNASKISDPTPSEVLGNMYPPPVLAIAIKDRKGELRPIKYPERWLIVIDRTYAWCKRQEGCHYEVARRRYNGEDYHKTCEDLHIDKSTASRVMDDIRTYAALQAAQYHLITVD